MKPFLSKTISRRFSTLAAVSSLCGLMAATNLVLADEKPATQAAHGAQPAPDAKGEKKQGDRLISIVLLLKAPHDLTHEEIAHVISEGTGTKVTEHDVVSKPPYHLVKIGADKYIVNNIGEPYFKEAGKLAAEIKQHDLGESVKHSKAWLSVDWVGKDDKKDIKPVYQMIGKMAAHLAGKNTVAVYSPDMDEFALWTPEVKAGLQSDDPLAVFDPDNSKKTGEASK